MYDPEKAEERLLVVADAFAALIASSPYLAAAPAIDVLTERKGDINATIAQALGGLGIVVVVVMPYARKSESAGAEISLAARFVAEISENPLINQAAAKKAGVAYRPALAVAVATLLAVSGKPNGLDAGDQGHVAGLNEFVLPNDVPPIQIVPDRRAITYHVTVDTTVQL